MKAEIDGTHPPPASTLEQDYRALGRARMGKPPWLRVRLPSGETYTRIKDLMRSRSLHTVCEEARCPNIAECWGCGTATFLILGESCTRSCTFCAVGAAGRARHAPSAPAAEAREVSAAAAAMGLRHAVITSVTRDDLQDGGASVFAEAIVNIHAEVPGCTVEVLIPDFKGNGESLDVVLKARPEILGHNVETVPRLYPRVRPQADYERSLDLLASAKGFSRGVITKSGLMVGLGETWDELLEVVSDLRDVGCDVFTVGQYLRPSKGHLPVERYYTPEEFSALKEAGVAAGFRWVESGPLVRSSYHAEVQARQLRRYCHE